MNWNNVASRLLTVKSIVTIILTILFAAIVLSTGDVPQSFLIVYSTVIAFYFGTQKVNEQDNNKN